MDVIKHIVTKEFLQFRRDPKMFAIILIAPVIQLIFLGFAVNMDVENVPTVIFDQDRSVESRSLAKQFDASGYFNIVEYVSGYSEIEAKFEGGSAILGIVIPDGFEKNTGTGRTAKLQAIFDGSDGNKASITAGYVLGFISGYTKSLAVDFMNRRGFKSGPVANITAETRAWYNPELKTRIFMVPGIVGLLLSIITLILTSLAIVKEKEVGTLEQIIVTPIKPMELILGKLIPFAILAFVAIIIVLTAMSLAFGIAIKGNVLFLFFNSFLYILSTLGLGLFVSTVSKTQQQAMMISIFVILMPMVFLSGFAFPIENMPFFIQAVTYFIPLRYFMEIIRGIILKGTGIESLWMEMAALFVFGVVILYLSSLRFKKRLE